MANMANTTTNTTHVRMHKDAREMLNRLIAALALRGVEVAQIDALDEAVEALIEKHGLTGKLGVARIAGVGLVVGDDLSAQQKQRKTR